MAFKMKGFPQHKGISPMKATEKSTNPKMNDKDWAAGNEKAKQGRNEGKGTIDLDGLVKKRSYQKKGSEEYKTTQNAINVALGDKTVHKTKANSRTAETQEKKAVVTENAIAKREGVVNKAENNAKIDKKGDAKVDYKAQRKLVKSSQKQSKKLATLDVRDARKQHGRGSDEVKEAKADRKAIKKANRAERKQNRVDDRENKRANKSPMQKKEKSANELVAERTKLRGKEAKRDAKRASGKKVFLGNIKSKINAKKEAKVQYKLDHNKEALGWANEKPEPGKEIEVKKPKKTQDTPMPNKEGRRVKDSFRKVKRKIRRTR